MTHRPIPQSASHPRFPDLPPRVLHADDWFVVIDKPSGLLSVPGIGPEKADCLVSRAAEAFDGARIVHRLDRDTSGVIVLALDAESHRRLSIQFQDRLVDKTYVAMVAEHLAEDAGTVDLPMRKDLDDPPRQIIDHEHGRPATTHWRVLERTSIERPIRCAEFALEDRSVDDAAFDGPRDVARLELRPHTGRSHQLRLHLLELGHPILGDDLYAPMDVLALSDRLLLHARMLSFNHPTSGERLTFSAPCPF